MRKLEEIRWSWIILIWSMKYVNICGGCTRGNFPRHTNKQYWRILQTFARFLLYLKLFEDFHEKMWALNVLEMFEILTNRQKSVHPHFFKDNFHFFPRFWNFNWAELEKFIEFWMILVFFIIEWNIFRPFFRQNSSNFSKSFNLKAFCALKLCLTFFLCNVNPQHWKFPLLKLKCLVKWNHKRNTSHATP